MERTRQCGAAQIPPIGLLLSNLKRFRRDEAPSLKGDGFKQPFTATGIKQNVT
jgi:hypothetical protein